MSSGAADATIAGMAKCPVCKKEILPRSANPAFPFCSGRCRAVDLGKWLGEEYRVAGPHSDLDDTDEDGRSSPDTSGKDGADA